MVPKTELLGAIWANQLIQNGTELWCLLSHYPPGWLDPFAQSYYICTAKQLEAFA